jgi:mannonate dehydratase
MPVVDWVRTDLRWKLPTTGYALRFDILDFAAYDIFILRRPNAEAGYDAKTIAVARKRYDTMTEQRKANLERTIIAGLPGAEESYDRERIGRILAEYDGVTSADLRANLTAFLTEIVPIAQEAGVQLAIHPDDPPLPLFGLPRVVSTAEDAKLILNACDISANGLTFCVGSYGARADNDLLEMVREFGGRIHFAHLRQVTRETNGSFHEAEHLGGSSDMVAVVHALMLEEKRRQAEGRGDSEIPMRPDHGHLLGDEIHKKVNPGYSFVGRLKGLAELRGVMRALNYAAPGLTQ